jgi:hypothetical protein
MEHWRSSKRTKGRDDTLGSATIVMYTAQGRTRRALPLVLPCAARGLVIGQMWRSLRSIFSSKISKVLNYAQHDGCLFKLQYHIESFKPTGVRSIPWCPPAVGGFLWCSVWSTAPDRVPKAPSSKRTSPPVAPFGIHYIVMYTAQGRTKGRNRFRQALLISKLRRIRIVIQHLQNVSIKLLLRNRNGVVV